MIVIALLSFAVIGVMAMYFPEILGNGKAGNQLTFTDLVGWDYALGLLATKWIAVLLALMAGAYGGRITPSMMLGSTLALAFAALWSIMVSPVHLGFAAFLGAVIFLGLAQKDAAYILCVHVRTFTIFRGNVLPHGASYGFCIDNAADCKSKIPIIK